MSQARVYLAMNDLARAQQKVDAAARIEPNSSELALVRGSIFGSNGSRRRGAGAIRRGDPLEWFRHAGARQPGQPRDARATDAKSPNRISSDCWRWAIDRRACISVWRKSQKRAPIQNRNH